MKFWLMSILLSLSIWFIALKHVSHFSFSNDEEMGNFAELATLLQIRPIDLVSDRVSESPKILPEISQPKAATKSRPIEKMVAVNVAEKPKVQEPILPKIAPPDIRLKSVFWGGNPVALLGTPLGTRPYAKGDMVYDGWQLISIAKNSVQIGKEKEIVSLQP